MDSQSIDEACCGIHDETRGPRPVVQAKHRWIVRRDIARVMEIEKACYDEPWAEEQFEKVLNESGCIGVVAEVVGVPVGFIFYTLRKKSVELRNIAVLPQFRRLAIGSSMIRNLLAKLDIGPRRRVFVHVRETNDPAIYFFRSLGFLATGVSRGFFRDHDEDAYEFEYRLPAGGEQNG